MCGVSKTKYMLQASLKNGLLILLVPLGCFPASALAEGWKKIFFLLIVSKRVFGSIMCLCKEFNHKGAAKPCILAILQKIGKGRDWVTTEHWIMVATEYLFFQVLLSICPVVDIHKERWDKGLSMVSAEQWLLYCPPKLGTWPSTWFQFLMFYKD